jgi:hypothetical protein
LSKLYINVREVSGGQVKGSDVFHLSVSSSTPQW